jgi:hypothetical protein
MRKRGFELSGFQFLSGPVMAVLCPVTIDGFLATWADSEQGKKNRNRNGTNFRIRVDVFFSNRARTV